MFYHLFQYLQEFDVPGAHLMDYITFRAGVTLALSLFFAIVIGGSIIKKLEAYYDRQGGENMRDLDNGGKIVSHTDAIEKIQDVLANLDETDQEKKDDVAKCLEKDRKSQTPSMGGLIIIFAILVPCLLMGKLNNVYMLLMILATLWCGALGFLDDYIKIAHHDKQGLKGKFKVIGQVGLGIVVALVMWASPAIVMSENTEVRNPETNQMEVVHSPQVKGTQTTIPFIKNHNFDYAKVAQWVGFEGKTARAIGWFIFAALAIFIVVAVSNAANLTDGLDGLASGTSAIVAVALAIMAYLSGNVFYAAYLNIMYIPDSGELVIYAAAFIGATIGFLWYNSYPAQVFMGDTGSLCIGGIVGVFALLLRKEWLLPILCGVFFVEALSNMLQTGYFKYTKRKTGVGKRIFKMAPIHHHYQIPAGKIKNVMFQKPIHAIPENKIVMRFLLISIILAVLTFVTFKVR